MIRDFSWYLREGLVRAGSPSKAEAQALLRKAEGRVRFSIGLREVGEDTAPYLFEDIYECLREAAQALMALRGYKPYSHEALIAFLREFSKLPAADIASLDRYRILRNKAVYSGERVSAGTCAEALRFLERVLPALRAEFERPA